MKYDILVIMCPPYAYYPEPPKDHSHSELFDCPKCKNKMWLSEKKKGMLLFASCSRKDIFLGCYKCVEKYVKENPDILKDHNIVNL